VLAVGLQLVDRCNAAGGGIAVPPDRLLSSRGHLAEASLGNRFWIHRRWVASLVDRFWARCGIRQGGVRPCCRGECDGQEPEQGAR